MSDDFPALTARAVEVLTALARATYTDARGDPRRYDFGETVCQLVTSVAANIGSVHELLAGRPGSWEADYVRQIVLSTAGAGHGDVLRAYRSEGRSGGGGDEAAASPSLW